MFKPICNSFSHNSIVTDMFLILHNLKRKIEVSQFMSHLIYHSIISDKNYHINDEKGVNHFILNIRAMLQFLISNFNSLT